MQASKFSRSEEVGDSKGNQQDLTGKTVKINKECSNGSEDYIQVKKGDEIKLLRKVG